MSKNGGADGGSDDVTDEGEYGDDNGADDGDESGKSNNVPSDCFSNQCAHWLSAYVRVFSKKHRLRAVNS